MLAEVMTFTKGNSLSIASVAARAVFPLPEGPSRRQVNISVRSLFWTCKNGISCKHVQVLGSECKIALFALKDIISCAFTNLQASYAAVMMARLADTL